MLTHIYDFVVIGSGISGISAANTLIKNNKNVLILDKARNSGGRLSTRIHPTFSFDHGAQFFTTKDLEFSQKLFDIKNTIYKIVLCEEKGLKMVEQHFGYLINKNRKNYDN